MNQSTPSSSSQWVKPGLLILVIVIIVVAVVFWQRNGSSNSAPNSNGSNSNQVTINGNANTPVAVNQSPATNTVGNTNTSLPRGWQIYADPGSGITNGYPADWVAMTTLSYASVGFRPSDLAPANPEATRVYIRYTRNPDALPLREFYDRTPSLQNPFMTGSSFEERSVGSHEGVMFSAIPGPLPDAMFVLSYRDYVVEIVTDLDADGRYRAEDVFLGVIESVQ